MPIIFKADQLRAFKPEREGRGRTAYSRGVELLLEEQRSNENEDEFFDEIPLTREDVSAILSNACPNVKLEITQSAYDELVHAASRERVYLEELLAQVRANRGKQYSTYDRNWETFWETE